jgi:hypothetical protein
MKFRLGYIVFILTLAILFTGCSNEYKELKKQTLPPQISYDNIYSITLCTYSYTGKKNELGKSKMITQKKDIEIITNLLYSLDYKEINYKEVDSGDFSIQISDKVVSTMNEPHSIGVNFTSKIINYNYFIKKDGNFMRSYKGNSKIIKDLNYLYNKMDYKEIILLNQ